MIYRKEQAAQIKSLNIGETMEVDEREGNRIRSLLNYYKKYNGKAYTCTGRINHILTITRTK